MFDKITYNEKFRIGDVLANRKIVEKFGNEIREYFYRQIESIRLIFSYCLEKQREKKTCYFPKEITDIDIEKLTNMYIEWEGANSNYLHLVYQAGKEFPISERTKLKAKKRYEEECEKILKDGVTFVYGAEVSFAPCEEVSSVDIKNGTIKAVYSRAWIAENLDYPTLLNNFIYMFEFVDMQFRFAHVCRKNQLGIFERTIGVKGKKEYPIGMAFNQMQMLAMAQMEGYYDCLVKNDVYIEDIIEWFFKKYLSEEFEVTGFVFNKPSLESTYVEKCRTIAAELDSILHQYKLWCEDGVINQELLEFSSTPISINQVPSQIENKYVYACGEDMFTLMHMVFSDQSLLGYIDGYHENRENFYDIVMYNEILVTMLKEYQIQSVEHLKNYGIIDIQEGVIIPNRNKMWIMRELFYNEVIAYSYVHMCKGEIEEFRLRGMIEIGSSLFSKSEMDYYNYLFNKHDFSNSLDIRNRYVHGNQKSDDKQNKTDYYTMLRMVILIIIKINEEFCLKDNRDE